MNKYQYFKHEENKQSIYTKLAKFLDQSIDEPEDVVSVLKNSLSDIQYFLLDMSTWEDSNLNKDDLSGHLKQIIDKLFYVKEIVDFMGGIEPEIKTLNKLVKGGKPKFSEN